MKDRFVFYESDILNSEVLALKKGANGDILTGKVPLRGNFLWCYQERRTPQLMRRVAKCRYNT